MAEMDIRGMAGIVAELIQAQKYNLAQLELPPENPRTRLALSLLLASLDHAESSAVLLRTDPCAFGVSAVALFRPQMEAFCRAVMFSLPTEVSDDEIRAFIEKDQLPQRIGGSGKKVDIWAEAVSKIAVREINAMAVELSKGDDSAAVFQRLIHFDKKELHGFVHGGAVLFRMYLDGNGSIGFNLSRDTARAVLLHIGRLSQLAFTFAGVRIAKGGMIDPEPMQKAWPAFCEHIAEMTVGAFPSQSGPPSP